MRKGIFISITVLILLSMLLSGCGSTPTPTPKPTDTPAPAPTEKPTEEPTMEAQPTEVMAAATEVMEEPTEVMEEPTEELAAPTEAMEEPTEVMAEPTKEVAAPTEAPTKAATAAPTKAPTAAPTKAPTTAPTEAPTKAATAAPTKAPTAAPTQAAAAAEPTQAETTIKVGLVTDTGGVNDKSFNQSAWEGVQKAAAEYGNIEAKFIESKQPTDYEKNIDQFATEDYDVIVTVGFLMGDATAVKAKQYPNIKFAIVDYAYFPAAEGDPDPYLELSNVTSLMYQEDEVGYLAGVLAAGMTESGTICSVSGMEIPPVVRFVTGYQTGAKWVNPDVKTLNVYIPSFTDPAKGKEVGQSMIDQGCDVVFGVGGNTGNGGLLAAKEQNLMAIGVDVDQYLTYPEVQDALISSAMKNVDVSITSYLTSIVEGTAPSGIRMANLKNEGIGLAPFHDWADKIPQTVQDKIDEAQKGLIAGTLKTGYPPEEAEPAATAEEMMEESVSAGTEEPTEEVAAPTEAPTKAATAAPTKAPTKTSS